MYKIIWISICTSLFVGRLACAGSIESVCNVKGEVKKEKIQQLTALNWSTQNKDVFSQPFGVRENQLSKFRWNRDKDGKIYFEREDIGKDVYAPAIASETCKSLGIDKFELVDCGGLVKLLYGENQLLFVAFEEYGEPKIELVEKATINNSVHFLVKTYEKGTEQYFDLFQKSEKWNAQLCSSKSESVD